MNEKMEEITMAIQKQKLAADILEYVGGVDNVRDDAASYCCKG